MTALSWPASLVSCAPDVWYDARTVSGGVSLTGKEQVAARDFGIWRATLSGIKIVSTEQVLALNALLAQLDGRAGTVMVPLFDKLRAPYSVTPPPALGATIANPLFERAFATPPPLQGSIIANPIFERRFEELTGTQFEFEDRGIAGTAVLTSDTTLNFTRTSGPEPEAGDLITLFGVRREITGVAGAAISFTLPVDLGTPAQPVSYSDRRIRGTAVLTSTSTVSFTRTSGPVPQPDDFLTLFGARRRITAVDGVLISFNLPVDPGAPARGPIVAMLRGAAAARAAIVTINLIRGAVTPQPGMHFSVAEGPSAYRIREIVSVAGSLVTCNIRPGLRAAAVDGATIDFETPSIEMRLTSDDQGHGPLDLWRSRTTSLDFIEA